MAKPTTTRRPPRHDGSPKHCSLCGLDKPRTPDNFDVSYSKRITADGLSCHCVSCHAMLVAVRRRRKITAAGGRAQLEKIRSDYLRSVAMLNVMLSVDVSTMANVDVVRLTIAELARLQTLPIIPEPEPKGRRRCTRPSN